MRSLFALIHPRGGLQMWGLEKDTTSRGPVGIGLGMIVTFKDVVGCLIMPESTSCVRG